MPFILRKIHFMLLHIMLHEHDSDDVHLNYELDLSFRLVDDYPLLESVIILYRTFHISWSKRSSFGCVHCWKHVLCLLLKRERGFATHSSTFFFFFDWLFCRHMKWVSFFSDFWHPHHNWGFIKTLEFNKHFICCLLNEIQYELILVTKWSIYKRKLVQHKIKIDIV